MKEIPSSNSKMLDLSKMSSKGCTLSVGSFYSFRCIITEKYEGNNSYVITTISHNYDLNTSNKYILAGVSLTPSGIDSSDRYKPGNVPSFSVPSGSNYTVSNVTAYPVNSSDAVTTLAQNSTYFITIKVSAKGSYVFTQDSRISYLPGFTSQKMTASSDGKSAIITGYIDTYCSHSSTKTFFNEAQHSKICNTCGTVTEVKVHSYSDWVLVGSDYERTCSACTHKQTVPSIVQADDIATTVHSLVFDFGAQTVSKAPVAPTLVALPGFENLSIVSFSWKDQDGVDVTLFEAEKTYVLTVELTINEESDALFSQNDVNVFSLTGINGQGVVSDDCKQVTVTFNVTPYTSKSSSITLPSVKEGVSIIGSKPALTLNDYCVIWKMNGVAIGSFDVINGEVSNVTDLNTEDGVDFSEQTFVEGNLYEIEILWNEDGKNVILDANNLTLVSNYAPYHSIVADVRGIATGGFYIPKADKIIRSPGVTGIVAPVLGKTPSTSKTSLKAIGSGFSITSVSWSKSGSSVKTFACGGAYTVKVTLTASEGYTFDLVDGSINGLQSSVSVSGSTLVLTYTFAKLNHNVEFGKASVTLPNCNEGGSVVAKCSNCSVTSSISVQALGHTFNTVNAVSPTCSSNGVSQHEVCYYCLTALSENENGFILPKDPEAHSSSTVTVHDGNYHYDICLDCGTELSEKAEHSYGEYITLEDGYTYHECECGHSVSKDGPKAPSVPVGDDEVIIDNGKNKSEGFGDLPIEKIKTLLLIMLIFAILLLGSIIAISIILIVTREKPVVATEIAVEGSNDISDKKTEQENTTVNK